MIDLVDTALFVARLRGDPRAVQFFRRYRGRRIHALVITKLELLMGMRPEEIWKTQRLLRRVNWIPVTEEIADQATTYMAQYSKTRLCRNPLLKAFSRPPTQSRWLKERSRLKPALAGFVLLDPELDSGESKIYHIGFLQSKTHGLTLADALIAATAKVMGAQLVTLDRDFFPMTDLMVHVPY